MIAVVVPICACLVFTAALLAHIDARLLPRDRRARRERLERSRRTRLLFETQRLERELGIEQSRYLWVDFL